MIIQTYTLGALHTNCYLVYDQSSHEAIVIDAADEATFIAEKILEYKLDLKAIIATHGHFDHNLGAGQLQLIYPHAPFYIHEKDMFLLKDINASATHWLKHAYNNPLPQTISFLKNRDALKMGKYSFKIIETPGHTPGSICLHTKYEILDSKYSLLFSGDTLFKHAIGRYDFSYSNKAHIFSSLNTLFSLTQNTLVYPGHEETTTIEEEKVYNT